MRGKCMPLGRTGNGFGRMWDLNRILKDNRTLRKININKRKSRAIPGGCIAYVKMQGQSIL